MSLCDLLPGNHHDARVAGHLMSALQEPPRHEPGVLVNASI
jgi:hypothetical protein